MSEKTTENLKFNEGGGVGMKEAQGYLKGKPINDRKEDIIKKSTILFFEQGYNNTTTRELAIAAGLSNAGIYYHFEGKEDILFHILNGSVTHLLESLNSVVNVENEPEENIRRVIKKMLEAVVNHRMEIGLLITESQRLSSEQLGLITKKRRDMVDIVKNEVERLKRKGKLKQLNITNVAFSLIAITNWPFFWYQPDGPLNLNEMVEELTELFLTGVLTDNHFSERPDGE